MPLAPSAIVNGVTKKRSAPRGKARQEMALQLDSKLARLRELDRRARIAAYQRVQGKRAAYIAKYSLTVPANSAGKEPAGRDTPDGCDPFWDMPYICSKQPKVRDLSLAVSTLHHAPRSGTAHSTGIFLGWLGAAGGERAQTSRLRRDCKVQDL